MSKTYKDNLPITAKKFMEEFRRYQNGSVTPASTDRMLTIGSANPASGVLITVTPNDINSDGNGSTQFTRIYPDATSVALTAPATASANPFVHWQCDGVVQTTLVSLNVLMDGERSCTAVYQSTASLTLNVGSATTPSNTQVLIQWTDPTSPDVARPRTASTALSPPG